MPQNPPPDASSGRGGGVPPPHSPTFAGRPTLRGTATAAGALLGGVLAGIFLVVPTVFYVAPMPADADGVTICLPGVGPLQRVREGLPGEQEELAFIHEGIHADQCRASGALWYARQAVSPLGRLELEAQALCGEAAVLSRRGGDADRLVDWTLTRLVTDYFEDGGVPGWAIADAVDRACTDQMGLPPPGTQAARPGEPGGMAGARSAGM